jgi:chromate transporter
LAPVTIGLMLPSGWVLACASGSDWLSIAITAGTVAILLRAKFNLIWLIGAAGLLGLAGVS